MSARKPRYFRVVYLDRDANKCGVSDAISDDTEVTRRTVELQRAGRHVNITTTDPQTDIGKVPSVTSLLAGIPHGYTYDPKLRW